MAKEKKKASSDKALLEQLSGAIIRGELNTVKELVQSGVPLDKPLRKGGSPPLHYAIDQGKTAIAKFLIESGADLNLPERAWQKTPLMLAAEDGKQDIFQALLAAGADIHAADANGWTALDTAARYEGSAAGPMVEALLRAGADIGRFSRTWGPPLIKACWKGHPSACRVLVAHGADVNVMTEFGTPLLQAIDNKRADVISILLAAGADPNLRYDWPKPNGCNEEFLGKTPLELARERKLKKIIPLLENPVSAQTDAPIPELTAKDVPALWKKLEKVLAKAVPEAKKSLAKPATAKHLAEVESATGLQLPDDFKASYLIHNGQKEDGEGIYLPEDFLDESYYLMPLKEILNEWKMWKKLVDSGEFRGQESAPDEGIRADWWHPGWLPFMSNGGGDSLCADLAPTEKGMVGQVIHMSHESAHRPLLARSFSQFLSLLIERWGNQIEE